VSVGSEGAGKTRSLEEIVVYNNATIPKERLMESTALTTVRETVIPLLIAPGV